MSERMRDFGGGGAESPIDEAEAFILNLSDFIDQGFLSLVFPVPDRRGVGEDRGDTRAVQDAELPRLPGPGRSPISLRGPRCRLLRGTRRALGNTDRRTSRRPCCIPIEDPFAVAVRSSTGSPSSIENISSPRSNPASLPHPLLPNS